MSEFVWTDELIEEFVLEEFNRYASGDRFQDRIAHFKISKQPKPEWEILEGQGKIGVHTWHDSAKHMDNCVMKGCKIHKVKRLSDGEVFTVGDQAHSPEGGKEFIRPITEFTIEGNDIRVHFREFGRLLQHVKKPLCPVLLTPSEIEKLKKLLNA